MRYAQNFCQYTERIDPIKGHVYDFTGTCVITGKQVTVTVVSQELFAYNQGGYIQDTLVSNNKDEREFLMSGMSSEGWDKTFQEDEE